MDRKVEIWKEVDGYEDYKISNYGNVKSFKRYKEGKILKRSKDKDGYAKFSLLKDGKPSYLRGNRLVALHYIDNPNNYPIVNHIDGDKYNDYFENLEWTDESGNNQHALKTGLHALNKVIIQTTKDGKFVAEHYSTRDAERATSIDGSCISKVCKGKRKSAGGFLWKFKH